MKSSRSCEELAHDFAQALATRDLAALAEHLSAVEGCSTAEEVGDYLDGLTEGQDVANLFWEVLPAGGESDTEVSYVHVCFDLGRESQMIILKCARYRDGIQVQDVEWGYPD